MRSVRELNNELLQVRVVPTSVSDWNNLMTVQERGRSLLTDVMQTYEFHLRGVMYSQQVGSTPTTIALPKNVTRVLSVTVTTNSQGVLSRRLIRDFQHIPTPATNLLAINERLGMWSVDQVPRFFLDIQFESSSQSLVLPPDVALIGPISASGLMTISGGRPVDRWPVPGYLEITPPGPVSGTDAREVIYYGGVHATGFSSLIRGIEGQPQAWSGGVVSFVVPAPNEAVPVWMDAAQGALYDALISDRAFYDKYTGIASDQAAPPERLVGLARAFEDKADRTYHRNKQAPAVQRHPIKRFRR